MNACQSPGEWGGLYKGSNDPATPESMSHPAKDEVAIAKAKARLGEIASWVEQLAANEAVIREARLRLLLRPCPWWLPKRIYRWLIQHLLLVEERR